MENNFEKRMTELELEIKHLNSIMESMNNMAKSYSDHYKEVNNHYMNLINEFQKFKNDSEKNVQAKGIFIDENIAIKILQTLAFANEHNLGDSNLTEKFASLISVSDKYNKELNKEQSSHKYSCDGKCHSKNFKGSSKIDLEQNIENKEDSDAEEYANDIINLIGNIFNVNKIINPNSRQMIVNELKKQYKNK